ncbi:hypothetical protein CK203_091835 [Vitis vinifera]|uniref:Uncharacterized protein n=1 Tax=Vitis vinifera TaxID=29760 RepID=A0A438BLX1_VITVI|nr:hypothetical protein CK203_091835 [Vitis vinifera]
MVSIPSGISQLCKLRYLDISHCKMLQDIPELPSSLREIDAHYCTSWKCYQVHHLYSGLPSSNGSIQQHLNCKEGKMILINGGIPGWVLHQEIGSQLLSGPSQFSLRLRGDPDEVVDDPTFAIGVMRHL